ncbi:S1 domain-containing RNA-binding protein [Lacticaseibacillus hulanensis]|jgi:S1 RNA binding domain protein|uniref:S1 domain-containing RNA-binding protein n=1 Tax=Lacticaseibacillus hulanensis TaxID=2493111 RepID=UPI000FD9EC26|nr:S1 domain-containing RNA-binding protein [Lacticaseibacillus hulanensis]
MSVAVGAKVTGKVTGITNFGAFVDLGAGQTGLVHISEVSNEFVKDIHDVLTVGDEVTVKVMSIKDGKIGLSIRKASDEGTQGGAHGSRPHSDRPQQHGGPRVGGRPQNGDHGHDNREGRPMQGKRPAGRREFGGKDEPKGDDFDSLLSGFLKDSEQRLSTIRHNTEGKRGGRGGRRS